MHQSVADKAAAVRRSWRWRIGNLAVRTVEVLMRRERQTLALDEIIEEVTQVSEVENLRRLGALTDEIQRMRAELPSDHNDTSDARTDLGGMHAKLGRTEVELERLRRAADSAANRELQEAQRQIDRLENHSRKVEDRVHKLLESRRWRIGSTVAATLDRPRLRKPQATVADDIQRLFDELRDDKDFVAPSPLPTTPRTPAVPTREPRSIPSSRQDVVVYTAIAGGYDDLKVPEVLPKGWQLVCFTDGDIIGSELHEIRPFDFHHVDPTRRCRYVKLHPHVYFPDRPWSVWIDANLLVKDDLTSLVDEVERQGSIGMYLHPHRSDVFEEAEEVVRRGRLDDAGVVRLQMKTYRDLAPEATSPLYETNVVVRRHGDPTVINLMNAWWKQIDNGSKRDQLSFPIARAQLGAEVVALGPRGESVRTSPLFQRFVHGHDRTPA